MNNIEKGLNDLFSKEDNPQKLTTFILNFVESVKLESNEFISAMNSKYEIIVDFEEGIKDEVPVPYEIKRLAEKVYTLVSIHNHFSGILPTIEDIIIGYRFNIKYNLNNNDKGITSLEKINPRRPFTKNTGDSIVIANRYAEMSIMTDFFEKYPQARNMEYPKKLFIKYYNNNINTMINIYKIHYNLLRIKISFVPYKK